MVSASQYGGRQRHFGRRVTGQAYIVSFISAVAFAIAFGLGAVFPPRNPVPVAGGAASLQRCAGPVASFVYSLVSDDGESPSCL